MGDEIAIQKVYVVNVSTSESQASGGKADNKSVSTFGTEIVKESQTDFSGTQLPDSPAKEAFKHFGKKYDDLAMMDANNAQAKLQMQLDDFAAEYPNAKLPKLPDMPNPAKFEKGKDGYQAYKMALMNYENVCSNKIENASRKAISSTVKDSAKQTQDVVRSTAKDTQKLVLGGVEYLAEVIDENTQSIIVKNEECVKQIEQQIKSTGGRIISVVRQESGNIQVVIERGVDTLHDHMHHSERNLHEHMNDVKRTVDERADGIESKIDKRADGIEDKMDKQHKDQVEYDAALTSYNNRVGSANSNLRTKENIDWGGNTLNLISRQDLPTSKKTHLVKVLTNVMTQSYLSEAEKEAMLGRIKEECANARIPYKP